MHSSTGGPPTASALPNVAQDTLVLCCTGPLLAHVQPGVHQVTFATLRKKLALNIHY